MNKKLLLSSGAALVASTGAAFAQTANSGDTAIDTAVSGGVTTLTGHIGTWSPEFIGLAVLMSALTMAIMWIRKRA